MITNETYMAAINWVREPGTQRGITIDIDPHYDKEKIWCYDYELQEGVHVSDISEIPSTEELKELKIKKLQEELDDIYENYRKELAVNYKGLVESSGKE